MLTWGASKSKQHSAKLIVDHIGLLLVEVTYMSYFSCPVIGQGARDEMIAAFLTIVTYTDWYLSFYTQKTPATFEYLSRTNIHQFDDQRENA